LALVAQAALVVPAVAAEESVAVLAVQSAQFRRICGGGCRPRAIQIMGDEVLVGASREELRMLLVKPAIQMEGIF
jgi:hypothetical protein